MQISKPSPERCGKPTQLPDPQDRDATTCPGSPASAAMKADRVAQPRRTPESRDLKARERVSSTLDNAPRGLYG